jgi:septal ring factor EnvC (AmiA/AmiB activator)
MQEVILMQSQFTDIRQELKNRMDAIQKEIDQLKDERAKIDKMLQDADSRLAALRTVFQSEAERLGKLSLPLFTKGEKSYRFAGMKITAALRIIRNEQPEISKREAQDILKNEGFDFRGKNPGQAVHFAWVVLDRKGKQK